METTETTEIPAPRRFAVRRPNRYTLKLAVAGLIAALAGGGIGYAVGEAQNPDAPQTTFQGPGNDPRPDGLPPGVDAAPQAPA